MDIPDFKLIIQWRARSLNICMLSQRLGRGARDLRLKAYFILFAEGKFFDNGDGILQKKKRPNPAADAQIPGQPKRKKRRVTKRQRDLSNKENEPARQHTQQPIEPALPTTQEPDTTQQHSRPAPPTIEELRVERQAAYASYYKEMAVQARTSKDSQSAGPDLPVSDIINAQANGIKCYRKPLLWYFDAGVTGELL